MDMLKVPADKYRKALRQMSLTLYCLPFNALSVLAADATKVELQAPAPNPFWSTFFTGLNYLSCIAMVTALVFGGIWLVRNLSSLDDSAEEIEPATAAFESKPDAVATATSKEPAEKPENSESKDIAERKETSESSS